MTRFQQQQLTIYLIVWLQKVIDPFLATMEKHAGGMTAEQKKEWTELLNKAYADMKTWGWYWKSIKPTYWFDAIWNNRILLIGCVIPKKVGLHIK